MQDRTISAEEIVQPVEVESELDDSSLESSDAKKQEEDPIAIRRRQIIIKCNQLLDKLNCSYDNCESLKDLLEPRLNYLKECRAQPLYQELKDKIIKKEFLPPEEIIYFSWITDDLRLLDYQTFAAAADSPSLPQGSICLMENNIDIMKHVLAYGEATDAEEKKNINQALQKALQERYDDRSNRLYFLNLPGVYLEGADLTRAYLNCANLENANLKETFLEACSLSYANLSKANLTGAVTVKEKKWQSQGPAGVCMTYSIATHANFNGVYFANQDFRFSDFSHASFKDAMIVYTCFHNVNMQSADLENASMQDSHLINAAWNLEGANLVRAIVTSCLYADQTNLEHAKFIPQAAFNDDNMLRESLDFIQNSCVDDHGYDKWKFRSKKLYLNAVANQIAEVLQDDTLDMSLSRRLEVLNVAIAHPVFQPESITKQYINSISQQLNTVSSYFFTPAKCSHAYYPTEALSILETAQDNIAAKNKQLGCR